MAGKRRHEAHADTSLAEALASEDPMAQALEDMPVTAGEGAFEPPPQSAVMLMGNTEGAARQNAAQQHDAAMRGALGHKDVQTGATAIRRGEDTITFPPSVRDKPNALYIGKNRQTGQVFYQRGKADKCLEALFGKCSSRLYAAANRHGFVEKPLLLLSQWLHYQLETEVNVNVNDLVGKSVELQDGLEKGVLPDYAPASGDTAKVLGLCFANKTIRELHKKAEYNDVSVLLMMRVLLWDMCNKMNVATPPDAPRPEAIVS